MSQCSCITHNGETRNTETEASSSINSGNDAVRSLVTFAHMDTEVTEIAAIHRHPVVYHLRLHDPFSWRLVSDSRLARMLCIQEIKGLQLYDIFKTRSGDRTTCPVE